MKNSQTINQELAKYGYVWPPTYKNILIQVWSQMETYFDEDEEVKTALWSSFKRYDVEMIGVVFITTKRTFTLESPEQNGTQIRYLPFDKYSIKKIEYQKSLTKGGLNYLLMKNDDFGNQITFACPNQDVTDHFIKILKGDVDIEVENLPPSDEDIEKVIESKNKSTEDKSEKTIPIAKSSKKEVEEVIDKDEKPMKENPLWVNAIENPEIKEVVSEIVPGKQPSKKAKRQLSYASKFKSKKWILWFLIPISLIIFGALSMILL